jgi:hypothetical protein
MCSIRRLLALIMFTLLSGMLEGCSLGSHDCEDGEQQCVGSQGGYRICSGGEGYTSWDDKTCPGVAPRCETDTGNQIRCVDTATPPACSASLTWPAGVALGRLVDVDGDGIPDNLSVDGGSNTVSIALGDAAGGFRTPTSIPLRIAGQLLDALPARLDGDAVPDLVVASTDPDELYVFHGAGGLSYEFAARYFITPAPALLAAADFDGDGLDEVLAVVQFDAVHILSSLGESSLVDHAFGHSYDGPESAAVANFDDALPRDVAIFHSGVCDTFIAGTDGTHTQTATLSGELTGDFDHDGRSDVAGTGFVSGTALRVTFAGSDGSLARAVEVPLPYDGTLGVGDFNGDQVDDIVAVAANDQDGAQVATVLSQGNGSFASPVITSLPLRGSDVQRVTALDFDRDGRSDLVIQTNDGTTHVFRSACLP